MVAKEIPVFVDTENMSTQEVQIIIDEQDRQFEVDFRSMATELNRQSKLFSVKEMFNDLMQARRDHFAQRQTFVGESV